MLKFQVKFLLLNTTSSMYPNIIQNFKILYHKVIYKVIYDIIF